MTTAATYRVTIKDVDLGKDQVAYSVKREVAEANYRGARRCFADRPGAVIIERRLRGRWAPMTIS